MIRVLNVPERDNSLYNFEQSASYIAHGCLLENIRLEAGQRGYSVDLKSFPDPKRADIVAEAKLQSGDNPEPDPLARHMEARHTNRKEYLPDPISKDEQESLRLAAAKYSDIAVTFIEGPVKDEVAKAASVNEMVVLENRDLHSFLYGHITWSDADDRETPGFLIDTLEINGPPRVIFSALRNWRLLQTANLLGLSRTIARQNARIYASGPSIAIFSADTTERKTYLRLGMALQRFWLAAEDAGISAQPISGIALLARRLHEQRPASLSTAHQRIISAAASTITRANSGAKPSVLFLMRIGRSAPASARTRRLPPNIRFVST
ncbi:MAG: nitroreductase family protein [bacterium]|nr:nitroreductase family protein [bacterium]